MVPPETILNLHAYRANKQKINIQMAAKRRSKDSDEPIKEKETILILWGGIYSEFVSFMQQWKQSFEVIRNSLD